MSKRVKQYLMLFAALGVVAIALGGGSGTFASFNAEVANTGNTFASGTLILNDNGGTNTCTSAGDISGGNSNTSSSNGCDTFFNVSKFSFASTSMTTASLSSSDGATATISVSAITGAAIYKGDTLTITGGGNTETLPAAAYAAVGATQITVNASGLSNSYSAGAKITDDNDTYIAHLTLTNAGTINASDISYKLSNACSSAYSEGHSTLASGVSAGTSSGTTINFAALPSAPFQAGDPVVISDGAGHAQTFIASSSTTSSVTVTAAQTWNYSYTTSATVSGPEFNGANSHTLCSNLALSIVETDNTFADDLSAAIGCATGNTSGTIAAPNACNFSTGPALSSILTSTLTNLTLASGGASGSGNSGTDLSAGKSRYFLVAVHYTGANFDNTYQNTKAAGFGLLWHIDQA